jgi:uncharacterized membrane protein (TIGR02234 family)
VPRTLSGGATRAATPVQRRRELTVAVLGCLLGGALALTASSQPWLDVTLTRPPPLPPVADALTGSRAAPLVPACGLLLLAAAVALVAVRGAGRVAVGLLVAVAGGALGWSGLRGLTGRLDVRAADVAGGGALDGSGLTRDVVAAWPAVALVAGLAGVLAGLLVVLRGRGWPAMGRRYERTAAAPAAPGAAAGGAATAAREPRPVTAEDRHQAAWKALDRGEDPTEDATEDPTEDDPGPPATGAAADPGSRGTPTGGPGTGERPPGPRAGPGDGPA